MRKKNLLNISETTFTNSELRIIDALLQLALIEGLYMSLKGKSIEQSKTEFKVRANIIRGKIRNIIN